MHQRGAVRVSPRTPVTVAIDSATLRRHFGVVANISEAGACVWTDASFHRDESLGVQLSFGSEEPFPVAGRVVWSKLERGEGGYRYGLQWYALAEGEFGRLKELIGTVQ